MSLALVNNEIRIILMLKSLKLVSGLMVLLSAHYYYAVNWKMIATKKHMH